MVKFEMNEFEDEIKKVAFGFSFLEGGGGRFIGVSNKWVVGTSYKNI